MIGLMRMFLPLPTLAVALALPFSGVAAQTAPPPPLSAIAHQLEQAPSGARYGLLVATLTAGLRSSGALAGLLALPLAVPLLIFGAGTLGDGSGAALKFLGAASLLLVAITPIAGGAAIRAGRD